MKSAISALALAIMLAGGAPAFAQKAEKKPAAAKALTTADADAFVAAAEKELFDYSLEANRVQWVKATYITEDTDALAAASAAEGTEKSVRLALEAAKFQKISGLSADTKRKLDILRGGIVLPAPTTAGAATELNNIATKLDSAYMARRARGVQRQPRNVGRRDDRVFRAAPDLAQGTEQGQAMRLVTTGRSAEVAALR